jgi:acyl-coenzyme A thioesterase PaaI-like protein
MPTRLQLPHTPGCLVCGRSNDIGLKLDLFVDPGSGVVSVEYAARAAHIGFEGIIHGGLIATVMDEAMVWAATWNGRRFCVCGELSVRFRRAAGVGEMLHVEARVEFARPRLIQTACTIRTGDGGIVAAGEGKYVPMATEKSQEVIGTFVDDPQTRDAAHLLARGFT